VSITEGIILCGGKGTRITSVTKNNIPKPLIKINGKSILEWQLELLGKFGIDHVVLATGHLADKISKKLGYSMKVGDMKIELSYSYEKEKLGSGGGIKQASSQISSSDIIILNGDILTNADITPLLQIHSNMKFDITMLLANMISPFGVAKLENQLIVDFLEKPKLDVPIHAGIDIVNTKIIKRFPDKGQMEDTIFVDIVKERKMGYFLMSDSTYWRSIDTEKDYLSAKNDWQPIRSP